MRSVGFDAFMQTTTVFEALNKYSTLPVPSFFVATDLYAGSSVEFLVLVLVEEQLTSVIITITSGKKILVMFIKNFPLHARVKSFALVKTLVIYL